MSDKAEAAWLEWDGDYDPDDPSSAIPIAFKAGYTAATADTEAQVRAAVEATIEEAARKAGGTWTLPSIGGYEYVTGSRVYSVNTARVAELIRALDASAIVAHIMGKEEGAE